MWIRIVFLFLLLVFPGVIIYPAPETPNPSNPHPGSREEGIPYIENFNRKDYKNQSQNWAILQDRRGIIYVANQGMLMEYDGVSWAEIEVPNKTVRSLAMAENGTIYVGGKDEIGYLAPGAEKNLEYRSLIPYLPERNREFSNVWRTYCTKEGVYYWTLKYLFRWEAGKLNVWEAGKVFDACFVLHDKVYLREREVGLLKMNRGRLELVPGGELFAAQADNIYMMAQYDSQRLLIGTRQKGFFLYQENAAPPFVPFPTQADSYLQAKVLYYGIRLSGGEFAMATRDGGLLIMDADGKIVRIFDKATGLQDESVKYVYEEPSGNLWLALEEGIARVEYASPISIFDENRSRLPGKVLSVRRFGLQNRLYAGTTRGLYYLSPTEPGHHFYFQPVPGISACWSLLAAGDTLLAATNEGVFQIEEKGITEITRQQSLVLYQSRKDKNRVWVGTYQGLLCIYRDKDRWKETRRFDNLAQEIRTITEDRFGNPWLGTATQGILELEFPAENVMASPSIKRYGPEHGLPSEEISVFWVADHVIAATQKGLFRYDVKSHLFIPDFMLGEEFAGKENGRSVFRIAEDRHRNIWLHSEARNFQAVPLADETYLIEEKPFLRIPLAQVNEIYPDPAADVTWFAGQDGLICFDQQKIKNYDRDFPAMIRKVLVKGKTIFAGYDTGNTGQPNAPLPQIPYRDRFIRFVFAAPFFEAETETRYRYILEGSDQEWSAWARETQKDYTNLDPGTYTFRVQAQNVYGKHSREDTFRFRVLPPWYGTWWAYLFYTIAGSFLLFLIVRWRSLKLVREKQKLELTIEERTREINDKNRLLEAQAHQLKEIDRVKSRFFANISHEFRTPLTLIMGPIEQMLNGTVKNKAEQDNKLRLMLRNSQRLLGLINQLLELSRFDSGKAKLQAVPQDIVAFIKGLTASFENAALQRELELSFHAPDTGITVYFDPEKLEEAVGNLLSNALKFTPAGGKVTVTVKPNPAMDEHFPLGMVEIWVCDTGPGIPVEHQAHIFDRFFQAPSTYEHHAKGSGIGLAIAREIVELHHGRIDFHNRETGPCGSEFILSLPLGNAHLQPHEIVPLTQAVIIPQRPIAPRYLPPDPGVESPVDANSNREEKDIIEGVLQEKDLILVVEDSADMRQYIKSALDPLYRVEEAVDGRQGIDRALELIPDLIISDIMMPQTDGYELCRTLKNDVRASHIPVILLTAKASEEGILEGLSTGADDYVTKPFSTAVLLARVKNLIDLRRHLQQSWNREMTLQPTQISVSPIDREFVKDLKEVIEKNISDPEFNVEQLSRRLYMSHATLYRKIHALTGEAPTDFIRSYRLKRGAELLEKGMGSVLEVALEVGFSSANYFSKCFKKKFQRLPSEYQVLQ